MSICQNVPTIDSKSFIDNSNNKLYESNQSQNFLDKYPKRQKSNIYKDRNLTESPLILSKHFSHQNTHNHSSYIQKKRELMQHKIMQETQMDIRRKQSSFLIQTLRKRVNQIQMSSRIQEIIRKKMKNIIQDLSTKRFQSLNYRHYLIFKDLSTIDSQKIEVAKSFRYTQSFFEAMSTMIGQPNKGETVYELAFSTIMLFSTIGMFATIINTVSMILDEIRQKQQEYRKNKEILNQFYNSQQGQYISQELKIQLLNYLRYFSMGHKELKQTQELQKVLKNFPEQLRKNVQRSRYTTLIRKFKILTDNFTNIILDSLVEYVEELYIMPNQIVFKKGIHTEPRLYLVLKGEISLEYQINVQKQNNSVVKSRKLKTVGEGQIFGEREFFSGLEADYTARSNTFSTILSIPRNEFIAIIKDTETDYQQFRYFQDQIVLTGSCPKICKKCKICFKDWHMENKCTLLQYVPNKLNLILR
ncbi:Cyclic nucleotide-binding protein [Pseudocohnilembus persalinus]|uniref:Cyclic nucleotide-binding protein n=1 Tax=Pseudocohnilembus persalinus TaxID=266149 RepID=A0A0V0R3E4_PSEPJ|nr:Cyclic nucleotide-binding protein [Pseudocohnilembus persalinus]|eukprot:KRX08990.1 Cyclic nucleotide-binding protein [Pseudocohnilembus persalinus]